MHSMGRAIEAIGQPRRIEGCKTRNPSVESGWRRQSSGVWVEEEQVLSSTVEADSARASAISAPRRLLVDSRMPLLVGLAYYLGAQFAFLIGTLSDQIFALFWPPNVILFCALLFRPRREWPALIAAAFIAHVVAEVGVGMPVPQLVLAFVTNCLVALL